MLQRSRAFSIQLVILYVLAFLIVREWLIPLPYITDIGNIETFIYFTLGCFILMFFRVRFYFALPCIAFMIVFVIHHFYAEGPFFFEGIATAKMLVPLLFSEVVILIEKNISSTSFEFQSLLFLLILAIGSYLIHFWVRYAKKIFFFLLVTLIYMTVLDTFTEYEADRAIIRFSILGTVLLLLLFKEKLEKIEKVQTIGFSVTTYSIGVISLTAAVLIGFYAPKHDPIWPDPVPTMRAMTTGGQIRTQQKTIGYSEDDEQLGGSLTLNDQLVFTAITKESHYWRGESKEIYTGKGWRSIDQVENQTFLYAEAYDEKVAVRLYEPTVKTTKQDVSISMVDGQSFWHLFYPGQVLSIEDLRTKEPSEITFHLDYVSGKLGIVKNENRERLLVEEYQMIYDSPEFNITELKQLPQTDPAHIKEVYLQLPESLPERVGELSRQITEGLENRYDKVTTIEKYFSKNKFSYQTENVAIPDRTQDYVDQFLFETQEGYCDNFSTAMVVLLRSIDIPARWVKGFTEGNRVETLENGYKVYEVRNENAHSWVEVYFNGVGWVPFEPTKGFNQSVNFFEDPKEDVPVNTEVEEEKKNNNEEEKTEPERENPFLPQSAGQNIADPTIKKAIEENETDHFVVLARIALVILLVVVISFVLFRNYRRLLSLVFLFYFKYIARSNDYMKNYECILWLLKIYGLNYHHNETLREYAAKVDDVLNNKLFSQLTLHYESCFYGQKLDRMLWEKNKDVFLTIIRTISS